MKTRYFIYPFCGCFLTSAAVAMTLYMDVSGVCGYDLCLVDPGTGCCPTGEMKKVTKLNISKSANDMVLDGLYITTNVGDVKLAESDGSMVNLALESDTVKAAVQSALKTAASSSNTSKITKIKENNIADTVVVNLDLKGATYSGGTSIRVARGGSLPTNIPERGDGATFVGWSKAGTTNKVTNVPTNATDGETYVANFTCPRGDNVNSHGTCINDDTVYIGSDGQELDPADVNLGSVGCTYLLNKGIVRLHEYIQNGDTPNGFANNLYYYGYANGYGPSSSELDPNGWAHTGTVAGGDFQFTPTQGLIPNEFKTLYCRKTACWLGTHEGQSNEIINALPSPKATGYTFRGYYLNTDTPVKMFTDESTNAGEPLAGLIPR